VGGPKGLGMVVFDVQSSIGLFLDIFLSIYWIVIVAYLLLSWIQLPYSLQPIHRFLYEVCEPYLAPFRKYLPFLRIGPLDLSPIVALLALGIARQVVASVLE
jgi:YggT family protein